MKKTCCCALVVLAALVASAAPVKPEATGEALINPDMGFMYYHYSNRL